LRPTAEATSPITGRGNWSGIPFSICADSRRRWASWTYLRKLEEVLIRACADYGVLTQRAAGRAGVWTMPGGAVAEKKIAALGVHVARGVTTHGFALNVTTDLRRLRLIVPCGISDRGVTSMEAEVDPCAPSLEQMANSVARHFGRVFGRQVVWVEALDDLLPGGLPLAGNTPAWDCSRIRSSRWAWRQKERLEGLGGVQAWAKGSPCRPM
jgi:lipoyl(octanoyl) transferase